MNRRLAAWTIAAVAAIAALGLSGCSAVSITLPGAPGATSAPPASTAPAEPTTGQSAAEACESIAGPLQEASTTIGNLGAAGGDPQAAVDAWTSLVGAYQQVSDTVTNGEVKTAVTAATTDLIAVRDALSKIYLNGDVGAISDLTTAGANIQKSLAALSTLCTG